MTEYELTRRDALKALGAAGITVGGGAAALSLTDGDDEPLSEHDRATIHAVALTVYPTEVGGVREFVDSFLAGRLDDDPARAEALSDAVAALDGYAREWESEAFVDLSATTQEETLRAFGVAIAEPDPDGDPRQRVRYYLVNELQFALYSSPTGGELVGIENPQGHPGGTTSYQRPSE